MRYGGDFNQHFPSAGMPWKHESWQLDFAVMRLLFEDPITSNVVCWYADGCESSDWLVNVGIRKSF